MKQRKQWLKAVKRVGEAIDQTSQERKGEERLHRIYTALFDEPCPYRVQFSVEGLCDHYTKVIFLNAPSIEREMDLEVACHELLHCRRPAMQHGKKFDRKVRDMLKVAKGVK